MMNALMKSAHIIPYDDRADDIDSNVIRQSLQLIAVPAACGLQHQAYMQYYHKSLFIHAPKRKCR